MHSVQPFPPLSAKEGAVEPPTKFSKKGGGLDRISVFRRGAGKERGDLFQGGCNFYIKNKPKSEIFNNKKSLSIKTFFSVLNKNLN